MLPKPSPQKTIEDFFLTIFHLIDPYPVGNKGVYYNNNNNNSQVY